MITFKNICLRYGPRILLQEVDWTIYHKQRIGIIGANGSGKSTLFSMLLQKHAPDLGDLLIPKQLRFAHVAQETPAYTQSALDYILDGDQELRAIEQHLQQAEAAHDGDKIAHWHEKLGDIDAYTAPARAGQLLAGLGFSSEEQQKPVSAFSGGWRVRLNLGQALMARSDVLLLDEPTNHLDLDAVLWLEQWLKKYPGTLLLISHDRDFLDQTVDHIAHFSQQRITVYAGNYSTFEQSRAEALRLQQATYEKQQKRVAHLQSFVDRFRAKASKARQAQSRLKAIERMDLVCAVQAESPFQFEFKTPEVCPNPLLQLEKASIAYGDHTVLSHLNLSITPNERITLLGPNGAGKSSLIKLLAGELQPAHGERQTAAGLKIGYFAQHQVDHLHLPSSAIDHLRRLAPQQSEVELRTFLGSFGFSGDRVFEPVNIFSGGEKSRLALALLVWQRPNLLLLDEPTNHLDLEMRQALSIALQAFTGAMLLVTHDRFLVRTTTDRLLLVADGCLQSFDGDLNDYETWLLNYRKMQQGGVPKSEGSRKAERQAAAQQRAARRPLLQKIERLEAAIAKLEKQATTLEIILANSELYDAKNKSQLQQHLVSQALLKKEMAQLENEWLSACEERDQHDE